MLETYYFLYSQYLSTYQVVDCLESLASGQLLELNYKCGFN